MSTEQAAGDVQDELEAVHQHLTQQQRSNLAKMEKQGWEAADWKARALEYTQKLAAANAQVSTESCGLQAVQWSLHPHEPVPCFCQSVLCAACIRVCCRS